MARTLLTIALLLTACSARGLALEKSDALTLLTPPDGGQVPMPFTMRWRVDDPVLAQQLADGQRQLAVFFDRTPMRSGQTFSAIADKECRQTPGCPDAAYLGDRDIFVTSASSLQVVDLPDTRNSRHRTDEHDVTVVVVDSLGRRQGEASFEAEFNVIRPAAQQ